MTLRRHVTRRGRWRIEIRGGEADGTVIDCQTITAAVRWYRLLSRDAGDESGRHQGLDDEAQSQERHGQGE